MIAVAALAGVLFTVGLIGIVLGLRRRPEEERAGHRTRAGSRTVAMARVSRQTRLLLLAGLLIGIVVAIWTGWLLAVILGPVAVAGVPALLRPPPAGAQIARLEALEEWTRSLAGVLRVGVGLEQAIMATARAVPDPIKPEVTRLLARLHARWPTDEALRAFADDLNDATGDLIAAQLILGSRLRDAGLSDVLMALASSVAEEVRGRRAVEADRAKPRATARLVTLITIGALAVLALVGDYVQPFTTPIGQLALAVLIAAYMATLVWMRRMTIPAPLQRFLGANS